MVSKFNPIIPASPATSSPASPLGSPSRAGDLELLSPSSSQPTFRSFEENLKHNLSNVEKKAVEKNQAEKADLSVDHKNTSTTANRSPEAPKAPKGKVVKADNKAEGAPVKSLVSLSPKDKSSTPLAVQEPQTEDEISSEKQIEIPIQKNVVLKNIDKAILPKMTEAPAAPTAVSDFLDSMKSELGVEPEAVIAALKKLSPQDLKASPEDTLPKVLQQLNLKEDQVPRAQQLVSHLTKELKTQSLKIDLLKMDPNQQQRLSGLMDVDQSLRQIFLAEKKIPFGSKATAGVDVEGMVAALKFQTSDIDQEGEDEFKRPTPLASVGMLAQILDQNQSIQHGTNQTPLASPASMSNLNIQAMTTAAQKPDALILDDTQGSGDTDSLESLISQSDLGVQSATFKVAAPVSDTSTPVAPKAVVTTGEALQRMSIKQNSGRSASEDSGKNFSGAGKGSASQEVANTASADKNIPATGASFTTVLNANKNEIGKPEASALGADNTASKNENVDQLTQQTQSALKKGGGEMVMKLTPEGMGQVHLKVSVQDGKVHVQMLADNLESKKMLETHLGDLKKSLEVQNIHVDQMRIDVGDSSKMGTSTDSGSSSQMRQQFMGQFSDRQENARQSRFENAAGRNYSGAKEQKIQPGVMARATAGRDSSRRLNLVA